MIYRDPTLSHLAGELHDLKVKNLNLEEENQALRQMLRRELDKEVVPEPTESAPKLSVWQKARCKWMGLHTYQVSVRQEVVLRAAKALGRPLGRNELFKLCCVQCARCGRVEKDVMADLSVTTVEKLMEVVTLFTEFYDDFHKQNSEA